MTLALKTFHKITAALWALLKPLGAWGVFAIAGLDGAGMPMPGAVDAVIASYVYNNPRLAPLYVLMAALGSATGCCVVYLIGYLGGEALLEKRMARARFLKIQAQFERNKFLTLVLPAMLPPPFPFKIFVLSAAVFEMKLPHFLAAIITGRLVRYGALAVLTVKFGPHIAGMMSSILREHLGLTLVIAAAVVIAIILLRRLRRTPLQAAEQ
jgi:membrane protein YqaA with SNARE-associated domain